MSGQIIVPGGDDSLVLGDETLVAPAPDSIIMVDESGGMNAVFIQNIHVQASTPLNGQALFYNALADELLYQAAYTQAQADATFVSLTTGDARWAALAHTHPANDIVSGNLAYARMPAGNGTWDTGAGTVLSIPRKVTIGVPDNYYWSSHEAQLVSGAVNIAGDIVGIESFIRTSVADTGYKIPVQGIAVFEGAFPRNTFNVGTEGSVIVADCINGYFAGAVGDVAIYGGTPVFAANYWGSYYQTGGNVTTVYGIAQDFGLAGGTVGTLYGFGFRSVGINTAWPATAYAYHVPVDWPTGATRWAFYNASTAASYTAGALEVAGALTKGGTAVSLLGHTHTAADITTGSLAYARMPSGTGTWDTGAGTILSLTGDLNVTAGRVRTLFVEVNSPLVTGGGNYGVAVGNGWGIGLEDYGPEVYCASADGSTTPNLGFFHSRGTHLARTATQAGDRLMTVYGSGHGGGAFRGFARIDMTAVSSFSGTNAETDFLFYPVASGATAGARAMKLSHSGSIIDTSLHVGGLDNGDWWGDGGIKLMSVSRNTSDTSDYVAAAMSVFKAAGNGSFLQASTSNVIVSGGTALDTVIGTDTELDVSGITGTLGSWRNYHTYANVNAAGLTVTDMRLVNLDVKFTAGAVTTFFGSYLNASASAFVPTTAYGYYVGAAFTGTTAWAFYNASVAASYTAGALEVAGALTRGGTAVSLVGHTHSAADITSGNLAYARMPTGSGTWDTGVGTTVTVTRSLIVSGTLTGALTGNASTATALQTARAINGVNFDGTAAITVTAAAGTLTGTVLNATVVTSSLTSVGTLTSLTLGGTLTYTTAVSKVVPGATSWGVRNNADTADNIIIANAGAVTFRSTVGGITTLTATTVVAALTGNADTATKLATARNINTVAFDGSADITVTAAAGTLTGTTLNATVVTSSLTSVGTLTSLTTSGTITMTAAVSKIVPGATSISLRNNADTADNLIITNAGAVTFRSTVGGITTLTATTVVAALTGNADTATKLATARTINTISFDGSANIVIAATNITTGNLPYAQLPTGAGTWAVGAGAILDVTGEIRASEAILSKGATHGIGYDTGAGGTVTQSPNKTSAVTLSKATGTITMAAAALASAAIVSFTLTNTAIAANDLLLIIHFSTGTMGAYNVWATSAAGSATVYVKNISAGSLSEGIVLKFALIKAVVA